MQTLQDDFDKMKAELRDKKRELESTKLVVKELEQQLQRCELSPSPKPFSLLSPRVSVSLSVSPRLRVSASVF